MKIAVLHGVNLNMFGKRDKKVYGTATLEDINESLKKQADDLNLSLVLYQTNNEAEFVEFIHHLADSDIEGVLINAGAWTHYNIALLDALARLSIPIVEVHMSNIYSREDFRKHSVISPIAKGVISGFGVDSYLLGLLALANIIKNSSASEPLMC